MEAKSEAPPASEQHQTTMSNVDIAASIDDFGQRLARAQNIAYKTLMEQNAAAEEETPPIPFKFFPLDGGNLEDPIEGTLYRGLKEGIKRASRNLPSDMPCGPFSSEKGKPITLQHVIAPPPKNNLTHLTHLHSAYWFLQRGLWAYICFPLQDQEQREE